MKKTIFFLLAFIFTAFVSPILRYYLTAIFISVATPKWLIGVLVPVVTWFIVFVLLLLLFFKPLMLQDYLKEQEFIAVEPDEFPQLDVNSLQRYTKTLELAGFVQLIDFTIMVSGKQKLGFARLFLHAQHDCWVEVNQMFLSGKLMPVAATIISTLKPDWSLSTTDRKMSGFLLGLTYIISHPRGLWINQPSITPSKLLEIHLHKLQQIANTLTLEVTKLTDTSPDAYFDFQHRERIKRKQALQRKNMIVGIAKALISAVNPQREWMGEYGDAVATKMQSRR
ncbi:MULTISPECIES: hypothetical protein [unclassified Microcoleus]|uniref:hypothetical protein n=1 Tax=unclassified Microcoleus TaxID=2642155 RepID=UPI0025F6E33E|nr:MULTISPECIES: hypothetical protein [unclassified Microcoleus]